MEALGFDFKGESAMKILNFTFEGEKLVTFTDGEQTFFAAANVCRILGLKNSRQALRDHCDLTSIRKTSFFTETRGKQSINIINEENLYRLVFGSRKESAKRFRSWVCSEVLPSIKKRI